MKKKTYSPEAKFRRLIYRQLMHLAFPEKQRASLRKTYQRKKLERLIYADLTRLAFREEDILRQKDGRYKRKYSALNKVAELTHVLHKEIKWHEKQKR